MRKLPILLSLVLICAFTGCPEQKPAPHQPGESEPVPAEQVPAKEAAPAKVEPSTEEAKDAVKLITEQNGKYELTPAGTLKSLTVDGAALDEAAIDLFAKQSNLEQLQITNFRSLNDAMVEKLTGLKKLKSLKLTNSGISDAAMKTIVASFPSLVELDISSNTLLTDGALKEVAKLNDLEQLTMMYCDFSEFGILDISEMPKLKMLDIRANMQVGNGGMSYIANLPALKSFKHMCTAVDDFGMESLSKSKGLETIEIQDFNITDRAGEFIRQFENLKNLIVFRCQGFGSGGMNELKGMKLTRLTLRDLPSVDDTGMEAFRELPTLRRLFLHELNSVSDAGMMNLVYLKDLELLDIWEVPITDKSMETISKLANVKTLSIRSTRITDASVDMLLQMPKLESLTITDNGQVTPVGLEKLKKSNKFKKLVTEATVPKR